MAGKPEFKIQAALITYLDLAHPDLLRAVSPAAGFNMSMGTAIKMKKMGYQKGTPDIIILEPNDKYHGLVIELKAPGGKISNEQQKYLSAAHLKGYRAVVMWGYKDAVSLIERYLISAC
jgi:hypothetical protein